MRRYLLKDPITRSFIDYLYIEKGLSQNSVKSYQSDLLHFMEWSVQALKIPAKLTTSQDINKYIKYLFDQDFKSSSVNRKISSIKAYFIFLKKKKYIDVIPTEDIPIPKQNKNLPNSMSEKDVETLLSCINSKKDIEIRDRAMVELLYATGVRVSELINIKFSNIDMNRNVVRVLVSGALGIIAYLTGNYQFANYLHIPFISGAGELLIITGALCGAGLGFLWFNTYPAMVFMGDIGALALGAALGVIAVKILLVEKPSLLKVVLWVI